jgi:hypothetical protein
MIASGWLYVDVLSSIDGEQFYGDQEQYFDEQNQQEQYFDQGKYNIGSSLTSYSLESHKFILHVSTMNAIKEFLALNYTLSPLEYCIG